MENDNIKWKQIGSFETNRDGSDIERKGEKKYNENKEWDFFGQPKISEIRMEEKG